MTAEYTFFEHTDRIEAGLIGYILNKNGEIIAHIKLDGRIISVDQERMNSNV